MTKFLQGYYTVHNPDKYVGVNQPFARSSWEMTMMRFLDHNPSILKWASESVEIPYVNPFTHKYTKYIPDFLVMYRDKDGNERTEIIEIKPKSQTILSEAKTKKDKLAVALNAFKWKAATDFANTHGMTFRVMNEEDIYNNPRMKR